MTTGSIHLSIRDFIRWLLEPAVERFFSYRRAKKEKRDYQRFLAIAKAHDLRIINAPLDTTSSDMDDFEIDLFVDTDDAINELLIGVTDHLPEFFNYNDVAIPALHAPHEVMTSYSAALSALHAAGDHISTAARLNIIGIIWSEIGEPSIALRFFTQARSQYQALGHRSNETDVLNNIARVWSNLGQTEMAVNIYEEVLILYRVLDDSVGETRTLNNIGEIWLQAGNERKAKAYFEQALRLRTPEEGVFPAYFSSTLMLQHIVGKSNHLPIPDETHGIESYSVRETRNLLNLLSPSWDSAIRRVSPRTQSNELTNPAIKAVLYLYNDTLESIDFEDELVPLFDLYQQQGIQKTRSALASAGASEEAIEVLLAQLEEMSIEENVNTPKEQTSRLRKSGRSNKLGKSKD